MVLIDEEIFAREGAGGNYLKKFQTETIDAGLFHTVWSDRIYFLIVHSQLNFPSEIVLKKKSENRKNFNWAYQIEFHN